MSTTTDRIYHGSCLCQQVKYEVKGEPITFRVCHCQNCRKMSGSAFMSNAFFKQENVRIFQGEDQVKVYRDFDTVRGVALDRHFCPACGSTMFLKPTEHDLLIIAVGTLDDQVDWIPKTQLFPEQKWNWVTDIAIQSKPRPGL